MNKSQSHRYTAYTHHIITAHAVQRNTERTNGDIPEVQDTRFAVAHSTQQSHADGGRLRVAGGAVVEVVDVTVTQESLCLAPRIDEQHCPPQAGPGVCAAQAVTHTSSSWRAAKVRCEKPSGEAGHV
jgi:hypothetical protein